MRKAVEEACESIDAAVFSGDLLEFEHERDDLRSYIERWLRAIEEFETEE